MAIEIHFTGKCEGCKQAELIITSYENIAGEKDWFIMCTHNRICEMWREQINAVTDAVGAREVES